MSPKANEILAAIETLSPTERHAVATEVIRRVLDEVPAEMSDQDLVITAEALFQDLDALENTDDESPSR